MYIAVQDTINTLAFGEDAIELMEVTEGEENEKEFKEEIEFVNGYLNFKLLSQSNLLNTYKPYFYVSSYNSPIKSILTPPPDSLV